MMNTLINDPTALSKDAITLVMMDVLISPIIVLQKLFFSIEEYIF